MNSHERSPAAPTERLTAERLAEIQGLYFAGGGVWPLLHMRSFEAVTGPKVDRWLVRTTGALLAVIGGALVSAARTRRVTPEIRGLAVGSAAAVAVVDVVYALRGRISPVYLLDAAAEAALLAGWALVEMDGSPPARG